MLYEFKENNRDLSNTIEERINSNLRFKTYIQRGLQQIEKNVLNNSRPTSRLQQPVRAVVTDRRESTANISNSGYYDENSSSREVESIRRKLDKLKSNLQ